MKKNILLSILVSLILFTLPAFAQEAEDEFDEEEFNEEISETNVKCSVANILKKLYGNVMVEEDRNPSFINLTLSVPRSEIETMLNMSLTDGWYPQSLVIQGMSTDIAAVYLKVAQKQNDSPKRFRVLGKLSAPGALPWKPSFLDSNEAYVTTIETDFGEDFLVKGETIKSNLIFTKLSPRISKIGADLENLDSERFASKKNFDSSKLFTRETYSDNETGINGQPFFERGTYKENPRIGRYMIFTLRCKW